VTGPDGLVFCLQSSGTAALGLNGGNLGYYGIQPSIGVEFDTYDETVLGPNTYDYPADHVAILNNGLAYQLNSHLAHASASLNGNRLTAWIDYDGSNLLIYLSNDPTTKPGTALINYGIDLGYIFTGGNPVYAGFTGGRWDPGTQTVYSWQFNTPIPGAVWLLGSGLLGLFGLKRKFLG